MWITCCACSRTAARASGGRIGISPSIPAARASRREPQNLHSLRASILVLGPLCVRLGEAIVPLPGGCAIGQRPVDIHLNGLRAMGAETEQADNCAVARGRLRGANIYLDFPSVGATENLLMAALWPMG